MQMLQLPHSRQTQTNKQTKNLSESLPGEEIFIDLVQTVRFFPGQSNPMHVHVEEQEQA
jgi:quercetin dioxygenase-like cupin family protein